MRNEILIGTVVALSLAMFFTWALEVHRTLQQIRLELKRIREELEERSQRP